MEKDFGRIEPGRSQIRNLPIDGHCALRLICDTTYVHFLVAPLQQTVGKPVRAYIVIVYEKKYEIEENIFCRQLFSLKIN